MEDIMNLWHIVNLNSFSRWGFVVLQRSDKNGETYNCFQHSFIISQEGKNFKYKFAD